MTDAGNTIGPQELVRALSRVRHNFLAGSFLTENRSGEFPGESGDFRFFSTGLWEITYHTGRTLIAGPPGALSTDGQGHVIERTPHPIIAPSRPPWSLAFPVDSTILGSSRDDWRIHASQPATLIGDSYRFALTNMDNPQYEAHAEVDATRFFIKLLELPHRRESLSVARFEPTDQDLADLANLESQLVES